MIGGNYAAWIAILDTDPSNDPAWYPITGDLDVPGDGKSDVTVTIRDDDDEPPGTPNDPTKDADMSGYIVSTCTRYRGGGSYRNQSGQGAGNTGNSSWARRNAACNEHDHDAYER